MKTIMVLSLLGAMLSLAPSATAQGSRSLITGFELGSLGEGTAFGNAGSVQSAIVRSGSFAYRANPVYSSQRITFTSRAVGGGLRQAFKSSRLYLYVAQLPLNGSVSIVKLGGASTYNPEVDLNWDGTLILADSWSPVLAHSQKALKPDGLWHRVEFDVGTGLRVYVDGELWASGGTMSYPAAIAISFGAGESPTFVNGTTDLYFDDIVVDAGSFADSGLPGDGHAILLRSASDPVNLNSWTNGAGASSSLWLPVRNVPAAGKAAGAATNMSQIKNTSPGSNQDYKPTLQTYLDAGIPAGATVNAVMAISNDGQATTKGKTKAGLLWIDQNPSQGPGNAFDFGDANGVIAANPAGWASHYGPVTSHPAVNLATAPIVAVRKSSGTDVDVDFLGVYVDYK